MGHQQTTGMARRMRLSFGGWLLTVILLANLFVFALVYLAITQSRQQYEDRAVIASKNLALLLEKQVDDKVEEVNLLVLALKDSIDRQMLEGGIQKDFLNARIATLRSRLEGLDGIRVTDAEGIVRYGTNVPDDSNVSIAEDEHFPFLKAHPEAGTVISRPKFGKISKRWTLKVVRRYNHPDGSFAGLVSGIVDLEYFVRQFSALDIDANDVVVLRDADMRMIARYPNPEGLDKVVGLTNLPESFKEMYQKHPEAGTLAVSSAYDGAHRIISYRKVGKWPLVVHVGLATDSHLTPWRGEARNYVIGAGIFAFVSSLVGFLLLRVWNLRKAKFDLVRQSHEAYRNIVDTTQDGFWSCNLQGRYMDVNEVYCRLSGYTREELLSMRISDLDADETPDETANRIRQLIEAGSARFESHHRRKDGSLWHVEVNATYHDDGEGKIYAFIRDITERKLAERALLITQFSLEHAAEPIFWANASGRIVNVNDAACRKLGYTRDELLQMTISDVDGVQDQDRYERFVYELAEKKASTFETTHLTKAGVPISVEVTVNYLDFEGEILLCGFARDITERKQLQDELRQLATTDELTGLANRRHFMELAQTEYRRAQRFQHPLSIALIDIDHFKDINDSFGHSAGDQVLRSMAEVFLKNVREIDVLARLGGDEFVLLLPAANGLQAYEVVERARTALQSQPISVNDASVTIRISAGIASLTQDETFDGFMIRADQALYRAKESGRNRIHMADNKEVPSA
jgi:diguanylate cyclase (GGDEF)-like protein/PAS domain S-box-containing protein